MKNLYKNILPNFPYNIIPKTCRHYKCVQRTRMPPQLVVGNCTRQLPLLNSRRGIKPAIYLSMKLGMCTFKYTLVMDQTKFLSFYSKNDIDLGWTCITPYPKLSSIYKLFIHEVWCLYVKQYLSYWSDKVFLFLATMTLTLVEPKPNAISTVLYIPAFPS